MTIPTQSHFERGPGTAQPRNFLGTQITFLANAADTGGAYSVMEATLRPGEEAPPHIHSGEDEAYYILEGSWTFRCGDSLTEAGPGSLVFLPRGLLHAFTLHTEVARALVLISPGGLDAAFRELSEPLGSTGPPPAAQVLETFGRYGVQFPT